MTAEIMQIVFTFLSGGLCVNLLNRYLSNRADKRKCRYSTLQAQIQNLYGPLHFFTTQNESFSKLNRAFHEAYKTEYEGKNWSLNEKTQENLKKETTKAIDLANDYIHHITQNNDGILQVLRDNFSHIDPDDIDVFRQFMVDYARLSIEINPEGTLETPHRIYKHVGSISFMQPEFCDRVAQKFNSKRDELASYAT